MVAPNAIFAIIAFFAVCAVYAVEATLAVDAVDIPVGVFGSVRHCLISYGFAVVSGMGTVPVPCASTFRFSFYDCQQKRCKKKLMKDSTISKMEIVQQKCLGAEASNNAPWPPWDGLKSSQNEPKEKRTASTGARTPFVFLVANVYFLIDKG